MRLEILHVPGCPNVERLERRLNQALTGHAGPVERVTRVVEDQAGADAVGMTGSPTLLVNGVDPFAEPGLAPSLSCRLYRDEGGRPLGTPTVAALRRVLDLAAADRRASASAAEEPADLVRTWRARAVPADPAERAVHRAILRAFATTGLPPDSDALRSAAAPYPIEVEDVVARLHTADIVRLGADGALWAAYPFSATPTRHRVRLAGGVEVYAMCVIDALGIPPMLGTDAVISTSEPVTDAPITVIATGGRFAWDPPTSVVYVGARAGGGPSAETCCDHLNAFTNHDRAAAWRRTHPRVPGQTLTPAQAELLGARIFGALLA